MAIAGTEADLRSATGEDVAPRTVVSVARDLAAAAASWDRLGGRGIGSPYQTRPFVEAWFAHLGQRAEPLIVTGESEWGESFVLPLAVRRMGPARVAVFPGDSHANMNVGLFDAGLWTRLTAADVQAIHRAIATARPEVDLLALRAQPVEFGGRDNPFVDDRSRPSPHMAYASDLAGGMDALLSRHKGGKKRSMLRKRENGLTALGVLEAGRAATPAEARALLEVLFTQKAERFKQKGIPDAFGDETTRDFFRALCGNVGASDLIDMRVLRLGDDAIATTLLLRHGGTAYLLMNSFCLGEAARFSPGEVLLHRAIEACCADGLDGFDFGVGDARYKRSWCDREVVLKDTLVPLTVMGGATAAALRGRRALRDFVVARPALYRLAQRLRRGGDQGSGEDGGGGED